VSAISIIYILNTISVQTIVFTDLGIVPDQHYYYN